MKYFNLAVVVAWLAMFALSIRPTPNHLMSVVLLNTFWPLVLFVGALNLAYYSGTGTIGRSINAGTQPFRRMCASWMKKHNKHHSIISESERREEDDLQDRCLGLDSINE